MKRTYNLSELLTRRMIDYGYQSVDDLAAAAGMDRTTIFHLLRDERLSPKPVTRRKLCRALELDPDVLNKAVVNGWTVGAEE